MSGQLATIKADSFAMAKLFSLSQSSPVRSWILDSGASGQVGVLDRQLAHEVNHMAYIIFPMAHPLSTRSSKYKYIEENGSSSLQFQVFKCEACQVAHNSRSNSLFDLVHPNVWGHSHISSNLGYRYFVLFIDVLSR
ncbi:hypothetical protein Lal_00043328 [Lupinus albus]|nr:hypothetical protein Lal_00043328 [Lupinus albus]